MIPESISVFFHRFYRAILRVVPSCITLTQAVALNMFLAFSPMILVVLGAVAGSAAFRQALQGIIDRLRIVLPPGTLSILYNFLGRHSTQSWQWVLLGLGGTLLAGTQMMKLLMEGFRMIYGDEERPDIVSLHVRALLLLTATILPSILIVNLVVFGRTVRNRMLHISTMPVLIRLTWSTLYIIVSLLIALGVLTVIYRVGRPGHQGLKAHLPGAEVATVLWWGVSIALGFYLRTVPYSLIYGGLAVTIGIMLWMQLTATILLIGAAYNAELHETSNSLPASNNA
ncbi:MAG TPA: YihY/virulence factor BrkB family protein [Candidatus Acidoferrales bacterium]